MKIKEKIIEIDRHEGGRYIKVDNEYFVVQKSTIQRKNKGHLSKVIFKKVNPKDIEERIDKVIDVLVDTVDKRAVLRSALKDLPLNELEKIERRLKKKVKIKEVKGCYGLKIGDYELPIVDG